MIIRQVSVIVCTHNRAHQLSTVIRQLCAQDYPSGAFEIIVVDNGSSDNTRNVVEALIASSKPPLRYILEDRSGVTFARNRGAEEALYPYLAYLDDDCWVEVNWLSGLVLGLSLGWVRSTSLALSLDYWIRPPMFVRVTWQLSGRLGWRQVDFWE
jgi:glycosyltransferase involved in cell wall biosynthesis